MWDGWERYDDPLAPARVFWRRVLGRIVYSGIPLLGSLGIGWLGYMFLANLGPIDAFLNAAMILGGMGPVDPLPNNAAKIFAGLYALYSGIVFLVIAGLIISPFFHRILHKLHLDENEGADDAQGGGSADAGGSEG